MKTLKKIYNVIEQIFELYIPMVCFIVLFCTFIAGIFARYVLKNPIVWSNEIVSIAFLWLVLSSACLAQKKRTHVTFTVVYDALPRKAAIFSAMLGNIIILLALLFAFKPTINFIKFMEVQKTSMLKIPFSVVDFPYILFMIFIIIHLIQEIVEEIMILLGKKVEEKNEEEAI